MNIFAKGALFATELPAEPATEIQWMPPGRHWITATRGGETITTTVVVNAAAAARLNQQVQQLRSRAAAGQEDLPYLDFNHDDAAASARVLSLHWGGEDPVAGGIRAKVEWTGAGRRALQDKAYRRFSPSFHLDTNGEVTGAPINMGGLVNTAAFKFIAALPLAAKGAGAGDNEEQPLHQYQKFVQQLIENLGMGSTEAEREIQKRYPEVFKDYVDRSFAEQDRQIEEALKGKSLSPADRTLIAATREANAANRFVVTVQARATAGTSLGEAINAAVAADPDAHQAWLACRCQPSLHIQGVPTAEGFQNMFRAKVASGMTRGAAVTAAVDGNPEGYRAWCEAGCQPGL